MALERLLNLLPKSNIRVFATKLKDEDYTLFLRHRPFLEHKLDKSNGVLDCILSYITMVNDTVEITYAIDEFTHMIQTNLDYETLIKMVGTCHKGHVKECYWKPDFMTEWRYDTGTIGTRYYVDDKDELHGQYTSWHENGKLKAQVNNVNGKKEGLYSSWYDDGQQNESIYYVNDKIHGTYKKWVQYFSKIKYYEEIEYVHGVKHGPDKQVYVSKGIQRGLKAIKAFENGKEHGPCKLYYPDGSPYITGVYNKGTKIGEWKYNEPGENYTTIEVYEDDPWPVVYHEVNGQRYYQGYSLYF